MGKLLVEVDAHSKLQGPNLYRIYKLSFAKLSQAQSNFNTIGWAELALIPPPPPEKVLRRQFQYSYWPTFKSSLMTSVPEIN